MQSHPLISRLTLPSQDHLRRQDLSFRDIHLAMTAEQHADLKCKTPGNPGIKQEKSEQKEDTETPEKPVNLSRERPILHRSVETGYRKIQSELQKSLQSANAAVTAWRIHPDELKATDRALLSFCRVLQFRLELGQRCLGNASEIVQLVPDNSLCSGGATAGSAADLQSSACPSDGVTSDEKANNEARRGVRFEDFMKEPRTQAQKFWEGDLSAVVPVADLNATVVDKILEAQDAGQFLALKKQWTQSQACYATLCKGIKQSADDLVKHMKVRVAENTREKKRKAEDAQREQLNKVKEDAKAAANAIKKRKLEETNQTPALYTTTWPSEAAADVRKIDGIEALKSADTWKSPWVIVCSSAGAAADPDDPAVVCLSDAKLAKALTSWGGQYKKSMAHAKLQHVTFPLDEKTGLKTANEFFSSLVSESNLEANIGAVKGGAAFMEGAWLFGCSATMKHIGFNPNHAGLIKLLAIGEVRRLLLDWDSFSKHFRSSLGTDAADMGPEDLFNKFKDLDETKLLELAKRGANMKQCILKKHEILFVPMGWFSVEVASDTTPIYGIRKSFFLKGSEKEYKEALELVKKGGGKSVARMDQIHDILKQA